MPDTPTLDTDDPVSAEPSVSFEEFKLYFESAERVTERRHALNRFNYSVSVAIILAIAAAANLSLGHRQFYLAATLLVILVSGLASVFCWFWIAQIDDAKQLNNAKFKVLQEMAPKMVFDSSGSASPSRSYQPFAKEWEVLQTSDALSKRSSRHGRSLVVLRGSSAEYFVPKSFRLVFACILVAATALLCLKFSEFVEDLDLRPGGESDRKSATTSSMSPPTDVSDLLQETGSRGRRL